MSSVSTISHEDRLLPQCFSTNDVIIKRLISDTPRCQSLLLRSKPMIFLTSGCQPHDGQRNGAPQSKSVFTHFSESYPSCQWLFLQDLFLLLPLVSRITWLECKPKASKILLSMEGTAISLQLLLGVEFSLQLTLMSLFNNLETALPQIRWQVSHAPRLVFSSLLLWSSVIACRSLGWLSVSGTTKIQNCDLTLTSFLLSFRRRFRNLLRRWFEGALVLK